MRKFRRQFIWLVVVLGAYCGMWAVTHFVGGRQIRRLTLSTMHQPAGLAGFEEVSEPGVVRKGNAGSYYCRTVAYAPFVVRVDYGWTAGPLSGDGGSELYLWALGTSAQIRVLEHWSN